MCYPEPSNRHSKDQNAIIVKKRNVEFDEHEDIVIGHVPEQWRAGPCLAGEANSKFGTSSSVCGSK